MSRKRCRRYRPRAVDVDPIGLAMTMAALLTPEQRAPLERASVEGFAAFRLGHGTAALWADLADAMNVAEALAEIGIASDHADTFAAAQAAPAAVWTRHAAGGSWTLRAAEITALDDAVFIHGVQLQHCSQREMADAITTVRNRVRGAMAGHPPAGAMVLGRIGGAAPSASAGGAAR